MIEFQNNSTEGVIDFEPWRTQGAEYAADNSRWYCHLRVAGNRIYEYGCPCGTCGIVFRKLSNRDHRITDSKAHELLGNLSDVLPVDTLTALARVLPSGKFIAHVIESHPRLVEPGNKDDFFATDVVRLFGLEAPDYQKPAGPETPYYRLDKDRVLPRTGRSSGPHKALVVEVAMPLHDPKKLNRERIDYWKSQAMSGKKMTAFAVSVIDEQAPALEPPDQNYPYEEQILVSHCLIDGHHRIQAAAELDIPIRILSFLAPEYSLVRKGDIALIISG